jgi:hypothetical protein
MSPEDNTQSIFRYQGNFVNGGCVRYPVGKFGHYRGGRGVCIRHSSRLNYPVVKRLLVS